MLLDESMVVSIVYMHLKPKRQHPFQRRVRTPSATGYYEVAAQARPMMMLAETCIIGGTMDGYSHLGIAEREDIMVRWKGHEGVSQIARELHRDKSTISREIRRNGWQGPAGRRYRAPAAQRKADRRRLACRRPRLMDEPERRSLVVRLMRDEHWSPEEISGRISEERPDLAVSDSAIYRAVESGSLDCGLPGHRKAARLLRHHGKRRHRKGSQERRGKVRITHDISERPSMPSLPAGARSSRMQRASRRRWERRSASAIPTIHGSGAPTRTPMAFSGTGSRRARASTMSATARCRRHAIHSAGDHASVSSGSVPGRSTTASRCTCSEDSPLKHYFKYAVLCMMAAGTVATGRQEVEVCDADTHCEMAMLPVWGRLNRREDVQWRRKARTISW